MAYGRTDIARRRLKRVIDKFGNTSAGAESRNLLISIEVTSVDGQSPQANCSVESCGRDNAAAFQYELSTPEHARAVAELADGVVVGSRALEVADEGPGALREYVASLRAATLSV